MQKGSVLPLAILLAVILGSLGAFYFYQIQKTDYKPQAKDTTVTAQGNKEQISPPKAREEQIFTQEIKEQTYMNNVFKFQFTFPKELGVKEDSEEEFNQRGNGDFRKNFKGYVQYEPGKFLGAVLVLGKDGDFETNPFTLWVFDNPQDLSMDVWYKNYWYYPFVWGDFTYTGKVELAPKDEVTISGQMAKSGIIDYQPGKPKFVYLSKEKKMFLFRIIGESGEKILSTFKFLN